jgi:tetratricopeptide (TPR) repeat protein
LQFYMVRDLIKEYWEEAFDLTADLQHGDLFSTPQLVDYLNKHLPPECEKMTKAKVNYLHTRDILKPMESGEGAVRTSWRYSIDDVRRALVIELLKTREHLSVQESKGRLKSFEEAQLREVSIIQAQHALPQEKSNPADPVSLVYTLLRSRTLATLLTALSRGEIEETPPGCFIAIRAVDQIAKAAPTHKLDSWEDVSLLLKTEPWHVAATDLYLKLHLYPDLEQLQNSHPEIAYRPPQHHWYLVRLQDTTSQFYELVLGLPQRDIQQQPIEAIEKTLVEQSKTELLFDVSSFPGLTTLLRSAFVDQPIIEEGTALHTLAEIIASASAAWDYCAILMPERSKDGRQKLLHVHEYSSKFPPFLRDKRIEVGQFLSGWSYHYRQSVVVGTTVANDPRIVFYDEERPIAAAAIPAIAEEQQVVGVIYVAKSQTEEEGEQISSEEAKASLKAFGYVCGDMIARAEIEVETIRSMTRLFTRPLITSFWKLEDLLQKVVDLVEKGNSTERPLLCWIYLLILNIQIQSPDVINEWLRQQAIELAGNFLANRLWDPIPREPPPIGLCEVESNQYVFAILNTVDLSEIVYKERITSLQEDMDQMRLGKLSPVFYPTAISFRYEELRRQLNTGGRDSLMSELIDRTWGALKAGPYIKRGHEALRKPDLDLAASEFEDALRVLRYERNSWYIYKHLAEARMLQGTPEAIEEAIIMCRQALQLKPDYASAHCTLADCLLYQGKFGEALIEYEKALSFDDTRSDFLTRYGFALASMTTPEYQEALKELRLREPELANRHIYLSEPWQEAIDKFDRVQNLITVYDENFKEQQERLANYRYQRGYAYLQGGLIYKALEDFTVGRKLAPDNMQLAQAYSYALMLRRRGDDKNRANEPGQPEIKKVEASS